MKVSDLARIQEPLPRFIQANKFIASLEASEQKAVEIRGRALLQLREGDNALTQQEVANLIGVSPQRISHIERRAKAHYADH